MGVLGIGKITDAADEYITLENKLKAVTNSTEEFLSAQKGVERIADEVAVPVSDVADSFLRYQLATESLGRSQEEVLDFTKRVTQAMILSGASAQEAHRAAVQLAQGFGKDFKAAAQDLKSVKEQAPVLARIIEKAAGGVPGTLLQLAKQGKINSKLVFDAVRADGAALDAEFEQRQKRFEDIGNLLGNVLMQQMKRLKPAFEPVIKVLEAGVVWLREWVKDGSSMNAVIAGAITVVGTLTYMFSGLALSVAATVAPFAALFLALDEFVAFIRGDESFTEDFLVGMFGKEKTDQIRTAINEIIQLIGSLFAALGGTDSDFEMAAFRFKRAMMKAIDEVWQYAREKMLGAAQDLSGIHPVGPQKQTPEQVAAFQGEHPIATWLGEVTGFKDDVMAARRRAGFDPETGQPLGLPGGGMVGDPSFDMSPAPFVPKGFQNPYGSQNMSPVAPVINNVITVQGNADAPVAREIANGAGSATAAALGRDRSAIGAGFGVGAP